MGGGSQQQSQTTRVELSPEQKWLFDLAQPGINWWAAQTPERYPGSTIQGFDPLQRQGQNMALGAARGAQQDVVGQAASANEFLMGNIWDPKNNPYLQKAITASTRPITENYQETVLPGIRDSFMAGGQEFGGSRRGVAEGIAAGRYMDSVGDTASKLVQDQYGNNLNTMLRAISLAPSTAQATMMPAQTVSGIGDIRQKLAQAQLSENVNNWNFDTNAPFLQSKELLALIAGLPGGSATSTANSPQAPWWQQAIGGASTAASMLPLLSWI